MAATKITTQTSLRVFCAVFAVLLACFAYINLFSTFAPTAAGNAEVFDHLPVLLKEPFSTRVIELATMREKQEKLLTKNPSDPFAWARLSYLRLITQGDKKGAFAALRMSDLLSPYEPRQQLERALMWHDLREVEDAQQQEYQNALWLKAFKLERNATFDAVRQRGLIEEVNNAMQSAPKDLLGDWNFHKNKK